MKENGLPRVRRVACEVGMRFGTLVTTKVIPHYQYPKAEFLCDCGLLSVQPRSGVVSGRWVCKCQRIDGRCRSGRRPIHGMSRSRAWSAWRSLNARCSNPWNPDYKAYGGRGICVEWVSFDQFYVDMGDPPDNFQIDRINNDGNYCKENCAWASLADQAVNKQNSKRWAIDGIEYKSAREAGLAVGLSADQVRIRMGGRLMANGRVTEAYPGYSCRKLYEKKRPAPTAIDANQIHE